MRYKRGYGRETTRMERCKSCGSHREVKNQDARFAKNDFSACIHQTRLVKNLPPDLATRHICNRMMNGQQVGHQKSLRTLRRRSEPLPGGWKWTSLP
jgi:hypothetical protein